MSEPAGSIRSLDGETDKFRVASGLPGGAGSIVSHSIRVKSELPSNFMLSCTPEPNELSSNHVGRTLAVAATTLFDGQDGSRGPICTPLRDSTRGCLGVSRGAMGIAENAANVERRLSRTAQFLASDLLAGRGVGTPEIEHAADFLRHEFEHLGLAVEYQPFSFIRAAKQGPNSRAAFAARSSGARIALTVDLDFRPLAIGDAGQLETPLVFVGYGITAAEANYDDYATVDVRGKTVIVLRHEPGQNDAASPFNGTDHSVHAPFRRKVKNAIAHGAAGIIFCTDAIEVERRRADWSRQRDAIQRKLAEGYQRFAELQNPSTEQVARHRQLVAVFTPRLSRIKAQEQEAGLGLLPFEGAGVASSAERLPVMIASRHAIDQLFRAAYKPTLAQLEQSIDEHHRPQSFAMEDWHLSAYIDITRDQVPTKNVVATLEGAGPLAGETVVVGAHYDHLGRGVDSQPTGAIHNGADDNASGVSLLLELADHYASQPTPPARRLVFVAFTGEERGLLGSKYYVNHPAAPLETTVTMFNFDMVGRMTDNQLIVNGTETALEFSAWVDEVNERHGLALLKVPGGMGPSDHASFCARQVPVLHFFTGMHVDYHRPSDDVELLDVVGMRRMGDYARELIDLVLESPDRPTYTETDGPSRTTNARHAVARQSPRRRRTSRARLWTVPEHS